MNNYKINFIYNEENTINDILIKVLKKEIKDYIRKSDNKNEIRKKKYVNFLIENGNDNV